MTLYTPKDRMTQRYFSIWKNYSNRAEAEWIRQRRTQYGNGHSKKGLQKCYLHSAVPFRRVTQLSSGWLNGWDGHQECKCSNGRAAAAVTDRQACKLCWGIAGASFHVVLCTSRIYSPGCGATKQRVIPRQPEWTICRLADKVKPLSDATDANRIWASHPHGRSSERIASSNMIQVPKTFI